MNDTSELLEFLARRGCTVRCFDNRKDWLEARHEYITASEVAAIAGESPFLSPFALFEQKAHRLEGAPDNELLEAGRRMEPVTANWFADVVGTKTLDPGPYTLVINPDYPWLACTLDRVFVKADIIGVLELKNANAFKLKEWDEDTPLHFSFQVQTQMLCTDLAHGAIASVVGGHKFRYRLLEKHKALQQYILRITEEFHERVRAGQPPEPDGHPSTGSALKAMYPEGEKDKVITLPREFEGLMDEMDQAKEARKSCEDLEAKIKHRVQEAMGDAHVGLVPNGQWSWKPQGGKPRDVVEVSRDQCALLDKAGIPYKELRTPCSRVVRYRRRKP